MKQLAVAGEHDKIAAVINLLVNEFTNSPQANHRKVGFFSLIMPSFVDKLVNWGKLNGNGSFGVIVIIIFWFFSF